MRKTALSVFLLLVVFTVQAQPPLDSLYTVWQNASQSDSLRTNAYNSYIKRGVLFRQPDSARQMANALLLFGQKQAYPRAEATAYNIIGISWYLVGDYPKSLDYYTKSIALFRALGDERTEAKTLGNIGNIYGAQGNYSKALGFYTKSLEICERLDDKRLIAVALGNIGVVYENQKDLTKALEYFERSLAMGQQIDEKRIVANTLGNLGNIYLQQDNYQAALEKYEESLLLNEEIDNKRSVITSLGNISTVYSEQGQYAKALEYLERSLQASIELNDKRGLASTNTKIGVIYQSQKNHAKTIEYCKKGYAIALDIGALLQQKAACNCLYMSYKYTEDSDKALQYFEALKAIEDTLQEEETTKKLQQMEFKKAMLADSITKAEEARMMGEVHQEEIRRKNQSRIVAYAGGFIALLLVGGIYSRYRFIRKSKAALQTEKDRSENLLLNILPEEIAEELKAKGKADARKFDQVSILFTDFKDFTKQSAKLTATDLVNEINHCFEAFDGIMGKYNIEKIKTIGDAYMAAGGLPIPTDDSTKNTVLAALEMQTFIAQRKAENDANKKPSFEMRVGIHTGPVVAGIVGIKKFQYDIWGDSVNTASRMESSGEVGKVNISQITYELLKGDSSFGFERRGKIEAKGKGEVEMYFVSLKPGSD